ncbi:MAG TPA: NADAR family protein [Rhodocyclaceae bacterium]|nr:NADAR family protein [Rhodocyclaceae bacterium]
MINDSYEPENLKMDEIRFYRANEKPYGAFSNLYRRPVEFEGELFTTAEHAYQAGKARKPEVRRWLMAAPTPALLAMAAHGLYVWDIAPNWSKIKFERMKGVLRAKFTQHEDLRELLLSTGSARLVESATVNNAVNRLWGEVNGVGQNKLGQLLMEVRDELRAELDSTDAQTAKRGPRREVSKSKKTRPSASKCHATVEATEA